MQSHVVNLSSTLMKKKLSCKYNDLISFHTEKNEYNISLLMEQHIVTTATFFVPEQVTSYFLIYQSPTKAFGYW